jgi:hypothetical protein
LVCDSLADYSKFNKDKQVNLILLTIIRIKRRICLGICMPSHPPAEAAIKFQTWVCFLSCVRPITEKNGMSRDTVLLCDWPYTGKNIRPMFETLWQKLGVPAGGCSVWSFVLSKRLPSPYLANTATNPTAIFPSHKSATYVFFHHCH